MEVGGPHTNLDGKIPIVLGTIPITSFQSPAPQTNVSAAVNQTQDFSMAPTQPVSPASPPNGGGGAVGWNMNHNSTSNMSESFFNLYICIRNGCLNYLRRGVHILKKKNILFLCYYIY